MTECFPPAACWYLRRPFDYGVLTGPGVEYVATLDLAGRTGYRPSPARNARHSAEVTASTGPPRSLLSRTATTPLMLVATSTQASPLELDRDALRHV